MEHYVRAGQYSEEVLIVNKETGKKYKIEVRYGRDGKISTIDSTIGVIGKS